LRIQAVPAARFRVDDVEEDILQRRRHRRDALDVHTGRLQPPREPLGVGAGSAENRVHRGAEQAGLLHFVVRVQQPHCLDRPRGTKFEDGPAGEDLFHLSRCADCGEAAGVDQRDAVQRSASSR
jgi:hypothetical protein